MFLFYIFFQIVLLAQVLMVKIFLYCAISHGDLFPCAFMVIIFVVWTYLQQGCVFFSDNPIKAGLWKYPPSKVLYLFLPDNLGLIFMFITWVGDSCTTCIIYTSLRFSFSEPTTPHSLRPKPSSWLSSLVTREVLLSVTQLKGKQRKLTLRL